MALRRAFAASSAYPRRTQGSLLAALSGCALCRCRVSPAAIGHPEFPPRGLPSFFFFRARTSRGRRAWRIRRPRQDHYWIALRRAHDAVFSQRRRARFHLDLAAARTKAADQWARALDFDRDRYSFRRANFLPVQSDRI